MAPPVPSSLKSQELGGRSDDEEPMAEEDLEDMEEFEAEEAMLMDEKGGGRTGRQSAPLPITVGGDFKCSVCEFTTRSRVTLQRHERLTHLKKKFFRCVKCNYVTHVKARYTKHVKYHSMPMIKCDLCEFRTPYKWNLDRHLKNHMGGGMYQCSLCNFTAHIKQSLTVHIQNHHLSPDKARSARRRNKVGASDQLDVDPLSTNIDADEAELLRIERMEHDARMGETMMDDDEEAEEDDEEMVEASSSSKISDFGFLHPDDLKNGRAKEPTDQMSPVNYSIAEQQTQKKPRPIPNLIPIGQQTVPAVPTILKIPQVHVRWDQGEEPQQSNSSASILEAVGLLAKKDETRSKSGGFLDQLAQKLAGNKAEKNQQSTSAASSTISWSSRCQHCRQRCKTRADLLSHLKQCPRALQASTRQEEESAPDPQQPHPMENKVFVWNQAAEEESTESEADAMMMMMMMMEEEDKRPSSVAGSDISEASLVGVETAPGIGAVTGGTGAPAAGSMPLESRSTVRRVYRCPQCSFWATTASRFHVHMVGHTNTKPFECSQCAYRSNWRWDITKHIKLKAARDPAHTQARVLLLDASGERHYDQYDRYLVMMRVTESGGPSLTHGRFANDDNVGRNKAVSAASSSRRTDSLSPSPSPSPVPSPVPETLPFNLSAVSLATSLVNIASSLLPPPIRQPPGLNAIHDHDNAHHLDNHSPSKSSCANPRRTIWKCKRCIFKDHNRETVLQHIRTAHYHPGGVGTTATNSTALSVSSTGLTSGGQVAVGEVGNNTSLLPPPPPGISSSSSAPSSTAAPAFRCGVCNQVSNWKHVIQRHCRLKHNGNIQVIENRVTDEDGPELSREGDDIIITHQQLNGKDKTMKKSSRRDSPLPDEDSMGYIMHPDKQQYSCSTCPYICKSLTDIELHRQHHKTGPGRPIKCPICPYYVNEKQDLAQHLVLHGMHDMKLDSTGQLSSSIEKMDDSPEQSSPGRRFRCSACPYVSDNKNQYVYHRQFHRPRGAPYKCSQCSYNVSRRHLLNQHLSVHGLPPVALLDGDHYASDSDAIGSEAEAEAEAAEAIEMAATEEDVSIIAENQHSVPASVNNNSASAMGSDGYTHLGLDPNTIPRLPDSATVSLSDIPLTWVSRDKKFYKMFKCRHCPHVNVRKANIQEHEKRHQTKAGAGGDNMHACSTCNYRCNNAGVLSAHVKVHQNGLGIIHALVDSTKPDEEQLRQLAGVAGLLKSVEQPSPSKEAEESCSSMSSSGSGAPQPKLDMLLGRAEESKDNGKRLNFCAHCPARFLVEAELLIHQRFHGVKLAFRCDVCSYTARQENHLLAHWKVHSREYQERTKVLIEQYGVSDKHPQPRILAVQPNSSADEEEEGAIDLTSSGRKEAADVPDKSQSSCCPLCPAKFAKDSKALQYHVTLHGSNGPYRCRFCNYAVKAQDNLMKHEKLHLNQTQEEEEEEDEAAEAAATEGSKSGKRYRCTKCPSSFEKKEQFKIHSNLHGSKQRYRCDRCDYAVKYYANYVQHMKEHDTVDDDEAMEVDTNEPAVPTIQLPDQSLSTADRQHIWLQDKLRSVQQQNVQDPFFCQYCPFRSDSQVDLTSHIGHHAANGATGSYRCNFCDFTVMEQEDLSEHIGLHFQLKGRKAAKLPESYWKCSNLEIWSEAIVPTGGEPEVVYDEKRKRSDDAEEEEDEDALYIDLSTGHPVRDEPTAITAVEPDI